MNASYSNRYREILEPLAVWIQNDLESHLKETKNIDRIYVRPKSIESFERKAQKIEKDLKKYSEPLNQIQDQVGARVIVFYLSDVEIVSNKILSVYKEIEIRDIIPDSENEFGYVGKHLVLKIPSDFKKNLEPKFFELQIKTLFQHAWSEANHDLYYKNERKLDSNQKRKIAFTAAQAWGADMIFNELKSEL